jgi:hypothetical protein
LALKLVTTYFFIVPIEPVSSPAAKGFLVPNRPAQAGIMVKPLEQISAQENNGLNTWFLPMFAG